MSPTSNDYGVKSMTVAAPQPGSNGSIQQNNTAMINQNTEKQMAARFGGARKRFRGGASNGTIVVPPMQINYRDTGTGNTKTTTNVTDITKTQSTLYANQEYDGLVGQKAGRKRSYKRNYKRSRSRKLVGGQVPTWGCMSGGKSKKRKRCYKLKSRKALKKLS
jgi:hypothetical protein